MDELQDAIEDAQYMSAMHDNSPRPTASWKIPTEDEYNLFIARLESHNPDALSVERLTTQCLGLYQIFRHLLDSNRAEAEACQDSLPAAAPRSHVGVRCISFIVDVILYKTARDMAKRRKAFLYIYSNYFLAEDPFEAPDLSQGELWRHATDVTPEQAAAAHAESFAVQTDLPPNMLPCMPALMEALDVKVRRMQEVSERQLRSSVPLQRELAEVLPGGLFDLMEGACLHELEQNFHAAFRASAHFVQLLQFLHIQTQAVREEDFALFRILGRGGFGLVHGCKRTTSGKLYAMKVMNKRRIKARGSEKLCMNERRVLAEVDSPFIVCLKYAFATEEDLFLILDLMTGGDLSFHLSLKRTFDRDEAMFYAVRTALGLRAMHRLNIVYRDLKPENILMDEHGLTRISDLGLACKISPRLSGVCGTRGYWAPEMIRKDASGRRGTYDHCVDWFSFGCVLYEFRAGKSPFRTSAAKQFGGGPDRDRNIDRAILEMEPEFPEQLEAPFRDLCRRLLHKDPRQRLGNNGAEEVLEHEWFRGCDWRLIEANQVAPPFHPAKDINAASQSEIGVFHDDGSGKRAELTDADHAFYRDWNWTSPRAYQLEVIEYLQYVERNGGEPLAKSIIPGDGCCAIV